MAKTTGDLVTLRYRKPRAERGRRSGDGARGDAAAGRQGSSAREAASSREAQVHLSIDLAAAIEWDYVVRNRRRWIDQQDVWSSQAERARALLRARMRTSVRGGEPVAKDAFDTILDDLAQSPAIEVSGPVAKPAAGAPAGPEAAAWALMPWEYLLASATGDRRSALGGPPLTVVRRVDDADRKPPPSEPIETVLFVAPAPGALSTQGWIISFEAEEKLVHSSLNPRRNFIVMNDPTVLDLRDAVAAHRPDVVHFAGMDGHQMRASLGRPTAGLRDRDAVVLADDLSQPVEVDGPALVEALTGAGHVPRIVSFNVYNSAAALAPLMVAAGVLGAIGFQDEIDDRLAELFFGDFYIAWQQKGVSLAESFGYARSRMSSRWTLMRGAGVALWTRVPIEVGAIDRRARDVESLVSRRETDSTSQLFAERTEWQSQQAAEGEATARRDAERAARNAARRTGRTAGSAPPPRRTTARDEAAARPRPTFRVVPLDRLNYSMLHNRRSIFETFSVGRVPEGPSQVDVEVVLNTGAEYFPFRLSLELTDPVHDLRDVVRLPLISSFWRTMRESTWTTLLVKATTPARGAGDRTELLFQQTYPVNLLPLDEWRDSDEDRIWLPSFVLPRDDVVPRVIDSAQKYLMALTDDRDAGFGGYQAVDEEAEDPFEGVDLQARAIWAALAHDYGLKYINPPPSFTDLSQRLRRPSDIILGCRGTCIDLALLYAACLEYVEIHPVLFLIEGHAFPGYWRDEAAHDALVEISFEGEDAPARAAARARTSFCQPCPWGFGPRFYTEIRRHIDQDSIVPIETTALTSGGSFYAAIEEGLANLRNRGEFCGMLDVPLARRSGVTPLPIPSVHRDGADHGDER